MPTDLSSTGLPSRVAAPLAYAGWWVTGLIFWFVERRDPVVRFHAAQAITAFGTLALLIGGLAGLALASLTFVPGAFDALLIAAQAAAAFAFVLWVVSVWRVATGRPWQIPIAEQWAKKISRVSVDPARAIDGPPRQARASGPTAP